MQLSITLYKRKGVSGVFARVCKDKIECEKRAVGGRHAVHARDLALRNIVGPMATDLFARNPKAKVTVRVTAEEGVTYEPNELVYVRGDEGYPTLLSEVKINSGRGHADAYCRQRYKALTREGHNTHNARMVVISECRRLFGTVPMIKGITVAEHVVEGKGRPVSERASTAQSAKRPRGRTTAKAEEASKATQTAKKPAAKKPAAKTAKKPTAKPTAKPAAKPSAKKSTRSRRAA